jgi:hypothetical protein
MLNIFSILPPFVSSALLPTPISLVSVVSLVWGRCRSHGALGESNSVGEHPAGGPLLGLLGELGLLGVLGWVIRAVGPRSSNERGSYFRFDQNPDFMYI